MVILKAFKLLPTEFLIDDVKTTIVAKAEILRNATPKMKTEDLNFLLSKISYQIIFLISSFKLRIGGE